MFSSKNSVSSYANSHMYIIYIYIFFLFWGGGLSSWTKLQLVETYVEKQSLVSGLFIWSLSES